MFWTVLALVMTVFMGGIIAYNGDLIGRKYGKRRLSLFGMRPKHTAILITSMTGVLVSALTTGVLFLLVPPVREIILDGEDAIRNIKRYESQNRMLEQRGQVLQQRIATLESTNASLESRSSRLKTEMARIEKERDRIAASVQPLRETNTQLTARNAELASTKQALTETNIRLARDNDAKRVDNHNLDVKIQELAKQSEELTRDNTRLTKVKARLSGIYLNTFKDFGNDLEKLKKSVHDLTAECSALKSDRDRLADENRVLTQKVNTPDTRTTDLLRLCEAMRMRRVVIHGGEDLARVVIPAHAPPSVVRQALHDLTREADRAAQSRGAGVGDGKLTVRIVDKEFVTQTRSGTPVAIEVTEEARINAIIKRVAESDVPVCVLAMAVANSVENEPASIDFQPLPNRLVYPQGKVVAARAFDATRDSERLFADLVSFLHDLGQGAMQVGMIPHMDPTTGEFQVGSIGAVKLADLAQRVRAVGGKVEITAVSAADVNAADPLQLDFRIEPTN